MQASGLLAALESATQEFEQAGDNKGQAKAQKALTKLQKLPVSHLLALFQLQTLSMAAEEREGAREANLGVSCASQKIGLCVFSSQSKQRLNKSRFNRIFYVSKDTARSLP